MNSATLVQPLKVQADMAMQAMRAELKEQYRLEREAAVKQVVDHFKESRVMSLEEQRLSMTKTFTSEMHMMERKLGNQTTELSTLRRTVAAQREGDINGSFVDNPMNDTSAQLNTTQLGLSSTAGDLFAANPPPLGPRDSGWKP
jgi:hypothetical protein